MIRRDADILRLDLRSSAERDSTLSLADFEAVRLVLRGGSPIDWHRLNFQTLSEVDDFLRTNLFDPDDPRDMARLEYLHREAIRYLRRNFNYRFPVEVEQPQDVRHLLLYASEQARLNRVQILSCVTLKTMHTINHLESRALLQETAISEAELLQVVEEQILRRARAASEAGLPIVHFFGSRKSHDSMVNKLISKRAARAADILDKVRFRIVVETREDVIPVLAILFRRVFPWNQVTAGQSSNSLVDLRSYLKQHRRVRHLLSGLQVDMGVEDDTDEALENEFSGSSYKMINFIIDVPVRLDHLLDRAGDPWLLQQGSIVYVGCEFQVIDQETAYLNERGENSHVNYKRRQREKVSDRLMWGLLREGRRRPASPRKSGRKRVAQRPRAVSALETAMTDSHPPISGPPPKVRTPRPPRPELPVMAPASDEPTEPGAPAPTAGPLEHNLVPEDSLLEPYRLVEESTLVDESSLRGVSLDDDAS